MNDDTQPQREAEHAQRVAEDDPAWEHDAAERAEDEEEWHASYRYREQVKEMAHADLLDALQRATLSNSYGSHDTMIRIVRDEILKRMVHYREVR